MSLSDEPPKAFYCSYCMTPVSGNHCVGTRKIGGCHETFSDRGAYWMHIHRKTGGCTNPANYQYFSLKEGVWYLKKDDTADHSHS